MPGIPSVHTMYGESAEELFKNAKEHGIQIHGYTEETGNNEITKKKEHFKDLIKRS